MYTYFYSFPVGTEFKNSGSWITITKFIGTWVHPFFFFSGSVFNFKIYKNKTPFINIYKQ